MSQQKQSAGEPSQFAVKEHVKLMLRKIPRKRETRQMQRYAA
ncbi:hypothetical protein [Microvirga lotononidis]|uniref:Uncharacterized protein n=1 Tax=Microvirga lotononidis TaxID=864069 RepID=I4YPU1_9HYPH|nr:hypothetical protein [Microvirga lotononidis]EIM25983.1 hypothetical protein MicloDRAFT_00067130 [Microvirga lotononidis]WQO25892.1 hypothetical protein U0023_14370 [Microvirga lotononidis]